MRPREARRKFLTALAVLLAHVGFFAAVAILRARSRAAADLANDSLAATASTTAQGQPGTTTEAASSLPASPPVGDGDTAPDPTETIATTTVPVADPGSSQGLPRVIETSPSGVRIALDAPITVKFDRAPSPLGLTITTEPPAEGRLSFPDATTATFTPARWADGKPYKVRVTGPGIETASFEFRTLFPPPERVEPGAGQRITFTFDDGADKPAQVTALLDYLEKEQIQAIFFPIGRWAEAHPRLVERMIHDGHRVCNHTYSHQNLRVPQLTEESIRTEIARGASDGKCRLFRPPLKAFDPRVEGIVASMGLTLYLWDVDSRDWEGATTEDIVNLVLAKAHPGAVVLFHMHSQASLDALPQIVPRLRKAGYTFRDPEDAGTP